jgi:hypothetical protein
VVDFVPNRNQGGLPDFGHGIYYVWLLEVDSFPPIREVLVSTGNIGSKAFEWLSKSAQIKDLGKRYGELTLDLDDIPKDFYKVPCTLVSIGTVFENQRASYKEFWSNRLKLSSSPVRNRSIRWRGTWDLQENQLSFSTQTAGRFGDDGSLYALTYSAVSKAHSENRVQP